ncbi:MAG: hypothetical protein BAJALOKI1v1_1210003 [Promethearchaeota archaeon]|nr:MAG: hypothetical protein BAJALOKI1v1_1210003 [Candidatus Lokiarchaeota archaeon]
MNHNMNDLDKHLKKYKDKEITLEKIRDLCKPGSRIYIGSGCSEPVYITEYLTTQNLTDCDILHYFSLTSQRFFNESDPALFRHNSLSIVNSAKMRDAIAEGKSDYTPIMASDIPKLLKSERYTINIAFIQISPPDQNGYCSLGINIDLNRSIIDVAEITIAQINPLMPRTMGDSFIHINEIDYFIFNKMPLIEYNPPETSEVFHEIARNTAKLIEDGSTLNFGVGKITYLLPQYLKEKQDLAIFSEFLMESIIELIEEGVVNCKKNTYPHCMISFILGTKRFYDFIDNNPFFEFHPTEFITNLLEIAKNKKLCSVYSALSVDLIGQVTNDLPKRLYSGIGAEADFIQGSLLSEGGKSIIAIPSTTESGKSRIVPILMYSPIALRAFEIQYVVTEYGIANLHGKTLRERVLSLIGVAHPKHRKWLLSQAKQANLIYQDQKIPMSEDGTVLNYPQVSWTYDIRGEEKVNVRPIQPIDERAIQELYYSLTPDDRVLRFFTNRRYFSHKLTHYIINSIDYNKQYIIGGFVGKEVGNQRIIAITEYHCNKESDFPELGELAITIHKDYRGKGLGRFLIDTIIKVAKENNIKGLRGDVLKYNKGMIHLLESLPYNVTFIQEIESCSFRFRFDDLKAVKNEP